MNLHPAIAHVAARLAQMPAGLRYLTTGYLAGPLFLPASLIAIDRTVNEPNGLFSEFWSVRGVILLLIIVFFEAMAFGFVQRTWWSRPLYFLPIAVGFIPVWLGPGSATDLPWLSSWAVFAVWYLFFSPAVTNYFRQGRPR